MMADRQARGWRFYIQDMLEFSDKVLSHTDALEQDAFVAVVRTQSTSAYVVLYLTKVIDPHELGHKPDTDLWSYEPLGMHRDEGLHRVGWAFMG